jgi:hypothetical protein
MVAQCVYCQAFLGHREPFDDPAITHGACDPCIERALAEWAALTGEAVPEMGEPGGPSQPLDPT